MIVHSFAFFGERMEWYFGELDGMVLCVCLHLSFFICRNEEGPVWRGCLRFSYELIFFF